MALRMVSTALLATKVAVASPRPQVDSPGVSLGDRQSGTCPTCVVSDFPHPLFRDYFWKDIWAVEKALEF